MTKAQIKKIAKNNKITHCYLYKRGYYYRPESRGYTELKQEAGIYIKEQAIQHAEKCDEVTIIPIDNEEHNQMIVDTVKDLMSRYIYKSYILNVKQK